MLCSSNEHRIYYSARDMLYSVVQALKPAAGLCAPQTCTQVCCRVQTVLLAPGTEADTTLRYTNDCHNHPVMNLVGYLGLPFTLSLPLCYMPDYMHM
jgi:hypothetical protein